MENINCKVQNKNIKRRSLMVVDAKEFIIDLLENNISKNQLINLCIYGNFPEKFRSLIWKILLNILPLNKPEEWYSYYKKYCEFYKEKISRFLTIKDYDSHKNSMDQYELIEKEMTNVNDEYVKGRKLNNINSSFQITTMTNMIRVQEILVNNKKIKENINELVYTQSISEGLNQVNMNNVNRDQIKHKNESENNNNEFLNKNDDLMISELKNNLNGCSNNSYLSKKKSENFFTEKTYLFYTENEKLSIEKLKENKELFETSSLIKLDIERTYQEIDLFKSVETKEILCKIIFLWFNDNRDLGYKQGMNEILATIFYASFNMDPSGIISNKNSPEYEKHKSFIDILDTELNFQTDLYVIFVQIMSIGMKSIYNYHNLNDYKSFSYSEEKSVLRKIERKINNERKQNNSHKNPVKLFKSREGLIFDYVEVENEEISFDNSNSDEDKSYEKLEKSFKYHKTQNVKIDFKIFENENMDKSTLEDILHIEQSDLRRRVNIIFFYYLKSFDPVLYNHLLPMIDPYIIIFRWILCLFNREITIHNVLYLWDCIFAIEFLEKNSQDFLESFKNKSFKNVINNLNFVNFLCVSIFEDIRKELLEETEACYILQMLMHFPNEKNVKELVKRALKIRNFIYDKLQIKNDFVLIE